MLLAHVALLLTVAQDPLDGQLPKKDLGVAAFLASHPDWDGRGIRVAVFDTGIDPGHPFLQQTPDGRRKLVDWYDATTDGRLDTSLVATVNGGSVIGLSGRVLEVGEHVAAGEVHLGRIGLEFLPGDLQARVLADRRQAWEQARRPYLESVARLEAAGVEVDEHSLAESEEARKWESFRDEGPVFDVLVYEQDGEWRVVIDSDEDGDLNEERALRPFRDSGDWAVLGDETNLNYAIDVKEAGARVQLFFDAHGHGTHVAGIIGSYDGPDSRLNGIAPGVELVAVKVGDGKFGGSTSGFAIAKALDFAVEAGCQVANLSFGGPSFFADGAEPDEFMIAAARERGLILVTSAGNEGPTLTTVGAPATSSHAISIAAAVWPDTQMANYASLDPAAPVLFDFSSRGPLPTGSLGVDFTAPGAALSSLPSWTLSKGENWNGTSMASPQMAGCVALLRCAAAAESLRQDPARIYRALRLSARPLPPFQWVEIGHGAIEMEAALEALRRLDQEEGIEQEYELKVENPFGVGAGIYQRGLPPGEAFERSVRLTPVFADGVSNAEKGAFLHTFRLISEQDWIEVPEAIYSSAQGQRFTVRVHSKGMTPGLHVGRVLLQDADRDPALGAEAILPVTVVVPFPVDEEHRLHREVDMTPGSLSRTFLEVPLGANYLDITVRQDGPGRNEYRSGAGSVSGFRYAEERQQRGRYFLEDGGQYHTRVPVEPGMVVEYAVAARWATNQAARLQLDFAFDGLRPQQEGFVVPAGQGAGYFAFASLLGEATGLSATATLEGIAEPVVGHWQILPDPIRPQLMGEHGVFQGELSWEQHIPDGTSQVIVAMPDSIQTTEWREDLALEVFDAAGAVVARTIMYERETDLGHLAAGDYRFRLRYPSLGTGPLEREFSGAEVRLVRSLPAISLYPDLPALFSSAPALRRLSIPYRGARTLFAAIPTLEALANGAYYYGTVKLRAGDDTVASYPLRVERPAQSPTATATDSEAEDKIAEARQAFEQADREDAVAHLAAARHWQELAPLDAAAALAVLDTLAEHGLVAAAREEAGHFLRHFPQEMDALREHAAAWPRD